MTVSAFIRSFKGDKHWLEYCLRALQLRGGDFSEVVIAIPEGDKPEFRSFDFRGYMVEWVKELMPTVPYISQQLTKCSADEHCHGDFIMHFDSDCIATEEIHLHNFFKGGQPKLLFRQWCDAGTAQSWRTVTKSVLLRDPCFETMASHPFIYHRSTHELFRRCVSDLHGRDFVSYVSRLSSFSEFNAIGNFCHAHTPDAYRFVRCGSAADDYPRPFKQFWSRGRFDREELEALLS